MASRVAELREAVRRGDLDLIIATLDGIGPADKQPDLEQTTLDLLKSKDRRIRNAAAIALADLGSTKAVEYLKKLIVDSDTKGARGTLLYALEELRAPIELGLLVRLLKDEESIEIWSEIIRALDSGRVMITSHDEKARAIGLLRDWADGALTRERREHLQDAAELIEQAA